MIFSRETVLKKMKEGLITITPFNQDSLEEASYDLSLESDVIIPIGGFALAKTQEKIKLSPNVACLVFTTSSLARKAIDVTQSSAFCHPKTDNQITLEIVNHNNEQFTLKTGDVVAKAIFIEVV